eukprot:267888-Hanusia_phi.AAC.1
MIFFFRLLAACLGLCDLPDELAEAAGVSEIADHINHRHRMAQVPAATGAGAGARANPRHSHSCICTPSVLFVLPSISH